MIPNCLKEEEYDDEEEEVVMNMNLCFVDPKRSCSSSSSFLFWLSHGFLLGSFFFIFISFYHVQFELPKAMII